MCRTTELGGLGIPNIRLQGLALRLRWEWLRRTDPDRAWCSLPETPDPVSQQLFAASINCSAGDGQKILFWKDKWLGGQSMEQLAPWVFRAVQRRIRNKRTVREALQGEVWISDITGARTVPLVHEFLQLVDRIQEVELQEGAQDIISWRWTPSGQYTSSSAYKLLFIGQYSIAGARELARTAAAPKVKFFIWLALRSRCWTNARRRRHNLQNSGPCSLCSQHDETIDHLLLGCVYSREVWFKMLRPLILQRLTPTANSILADWWCTSRKSLPKETRKTFDSLLVLVCWELWKERNRRVFNDEARQASNLVSQIRQEAHCWSQAGFRSLGSLQLTM